jgi:carboxylate-amine ligase
VSDPAPPPPAWSEWKQRERAEYTIGLEEEVMLLSDDFSLANRVEAVMPRLPELVAIQASRETQNSVIELCTEVHTDVGGAVEQLRSLRTELTDTLAALHLRGACAGTHPFAVWEEIAVTSGDRQELVHGSMRELARREPTFALHIHVGLADPELAIDVYNSMRVHLPLLLALSANSPYWQGRDTGLASARTPLFQAFPRVGIPRTFSDYSHYVKSVDLLIETGAIPDRSYLWWDIRPQPGIGTIEIRIMDAQTRSDDTAALAALALSLVKLEAEEGFASAKSIEAQEALTENRFLAARDGVHADLIDIDRESRRPFAELLETMIARVRPHAAELGCLDELDTGAGLARHSPADRQRAIADETPTLAQLVARLADDFA